MNFSRKLQGLTLVMLWFWAARHFPRCSVGGRVAREGSKRISANPMGHGSGWTMLVPGAAAGLNNSAGPF